MLNLAMWLFIGMAVCGAVLLSMACFAWGQMHKEITTRLRGDVERTRQAAEDALLLQFQLSELCEKFTCDQLSSEKGNG